MTPPRISVRAKRAFTLIELLVVLGIMGMLATIATGGYYAATRSMAVRGALDATTSTIRMAKQRAASTQSRTAVFFRNELLRRGDKYENEVVRGVVCAVRATGRFSAVRQTTAGKCLVDEFNDFNQSYAVSDGKSSLEGTEFKIYKLPSNPTQVPKGDDFSVVYGKVVDIAGDKIHQASYRDSLLATTEIALNAFDVDACAAAYLRDAVPDKSNAGHMGSEIHAFAFVQKESGRGSGNAGNWAAGDCYGVEIAVIQLPAGFIFGNSVPTSGKPVVTDPVKPILFGPDGSVHGNTAVQISLCQNTGSAEGKVSPVANWTTDVVKDTD